MSDAINNPAQVASPLSPGEQTRDLQVMLNRLSFQYPAIPKIPDPNGVADAVTRDAVLVFQTVFGLPATGETEAATLRRMEELFRAVRRADWAWRAYRETAGLPGQFRRVLRVGDEGDDVTVLTARLGLIALFDDLPAPSTGDLLEESVLRTVAAFGQAAGVPVGDVVDRPVWEAIDRACRGIEAAVSWPVGGRAFPGRTLRMGAQGEDVAMLQEYLAAVAAVYPDIDRAPVSGVFGSQTMAAVGGFQRRFGLPPSLTVDAVFWQTLADVYTDLTIGFRKRVGQYPGLVLEVEH